MNKVEFEFRRYHDEYNDDEYQAFADKIVSAAEYVTSGFKGAEKESGIMVVNAQCDDAFCYTVPFSTTDDLKDLLRCMSYNGWELTYGESFNVEVGYRTDGNFYIKVERLGEEDYVALVIHDTAV